MFSLCNFKLLLAFDRTFSHCIYCLWLRRLFAFKDLTNPTWTRHFISSSLNCVLLWQQLNACDGL